MSSTLTPEKIAVLKEAAQLGVLKSLRGKTFVLTGKMSMTRADMQALIAACGGTMSAKCGYGVQYLIVGDEGATAGGGVTIKRREARRYRILEITEEEFVEMLMPS